MIAQYGYVGLGSNEGDSEALLAKARQGLGAATNIQVTRASRVYRTQPQDWTDQPWFWNQVLEVRTSLSPLELLDVTQSLEQELGRRRDGRRYGPRTIDIDILLLGSLTLQDPRLTVPHPRLTQRAFVLIPLVEIAPACVLPDGTSVTQALSQLVYTCIGGCIWQPY
jgi:2-amino-4-hydroxy-6-hydroxymethyldihydropteridine diphosphokinase